MKKAKRVLSGLLIFCLLLPFVPAEVFAADIVDSGTCGDNLTWTLDSEGTLTISGTGEMEDYSYGGSPWYTFSLRESIQTIIVESGVTTIGVCAFYYCSNATSVSLPNSLIALGENAFRGCGSLSSITIPSDVTSIGNCAFANCDSLVTFNVDEDNEYFMSQNDVILNKAGTELILYPTGKENGDEIPIGITAIGPYAFAYSEVLNVKIPNGVETIGDYAFYVCSDLYSISIPEGVKTIGKYAFESCESLENIDIPNSVTSIGSGAFGWSGLTSLIIGENVETWDCGQCQNLTSVTLSEGITSIEDFAFFNCNQLPSIVIPDSVTSIGLWAFQYCRSLVSISIPANLTSIAANALCWCDNLTSIEVAAENPNYSSKSGVLFSKNKTEIICYPRGVSGEYIVPKGVTSIHACAFATCSNVDRVIIQNGVTYIGESAFGSCSNLNSIVIPDTVAHIDCSAFDGCGSLTDVYYSGDETEWGNIAIKPGNDTLKNATIHYNSNIAELQKKDVPRGSYMFHVVDSDGDPISGAEVTVDSDSQETDIKGEATFSAFTVGNPVVTVSKSGYTTWTNQDSNWEKSAERYETVVLYTDAEGAYKLREARYSNSSDFSSNTNLLVKTKKLALKNNNVLVGDLDFGKFYLSCQSYSPDSTEKYQLLQNNAVVAESEDGKFTLSVTSFSKGGNCSVRVIATDGTEVDTHINLEFAENSVNSDTELKLSSQNISFAVGDDVPFVGGSTISCSLPLSQKLTIAASGDKLQVGFNVNLAGGDSPEEQMKDVKDLVAKMKKYGNTNVGLSSADRKKMKKLVQESNDAKFFKNGTLDFLGYAEGDIGSKTAKGEVMLVFTIDAVKASYNTIVWVVPVTVQFSVELGVTGIGSVEYDWEKSTLSGGVSLEPSAELTAFGGVGVSGVAGVGAYGSAKLEALVRLIGTPSGWQTVDLTGELGVKAYLAILSYEKAFAHHTWNLYTANSVKSQSLNSDSDGDGMYDLENYTVEDLSYLERESDWLGTGSFRLQSASATVELNPLLENTYRNAQPSLVSDGSTLYGAFLRSDGDTVYAVITTSDGTSWSEPVRVDENACLDDAPQLYAENGTVFLTYAQTKSGTDGTNAVEYAQNQSVVVGTVDASGIFTRAETFTPGTGYRAYLQTLGTVDGKTTLAWAEAEITEQNDIFTPSHVVIKASTYDGSAWSDPVTVTTVSSPVRQLVVGGSGVAALLDTDSDLSTTEDTRLTLFSLSSGKTDLASGVAGTVSYVTLPGDDSTVFVWNGEECLTASDGQTISAPGITSEYQVTSSGIYYSRADEGCANLVKLPYVEGDWGEPITLTNGGRYLENLQIATLSGSDYVFGMHTAVTIDEEHVTPEKNLVWARVIPVSDLRIDSADYDWDAATPGETVPVTVTVTNGGDHTVSGISLDLNGTVTQDTAALAPGESREITVDIVCPEALTEYNFTVTETDSSLADDYTPDNNTMTVSMGYGNLSISLSYEQIGQARDLVAMVSNTGAEPIGGTVTFYDEAGEAYGVTKLDEIASGDITLVRFSVPTDFGSRFGGDVTAQVTTDSAELYDYDNTATLRITEVLSVEIVSVTGASTSVTAEIQYLGNAGEGTAYCAFYEGNGKMLAVRQQTLDSETTTYRFEKVSGAVRAKVFILDSNTASMCEAGEIALDK